jgi:hypothetical protein
MERKSGAWMIRGKDQRVHCGGAAQFRDPGEPYFTSCENARIYMKCGTQYVYE